MDNTSLQETVLELEEHIKELEEDLSLERSIGTNSSTAMPTTEQVCPK